LQKGACVLLSSFLYCLTSLSSWSSKTGTSFDKLLLEVGSYDRIFIYSCLFKEIQPESSARKSEDVNSISNFQRYLSLRSKINMDSEIVALQVLSFRSSGARGRKASPGAVGKMHVLPVSLLHWTLGELV
jgi:hypothetical protein